MVNLSAHKVIYLVVPKVQGDIKWVIFWITSDLQNMYILREYGSSREDVSVECKFLKSSIVSLHRLF